MDGPTGKGVVSDHKEHPVIGVPMPGQCVGCQPALRGCFPLRCQLLVQSAMAKATGYHYIKLNRSKCLWPFLFKWEQCDW